MRFGPVSLDHAEGRILAHNVSDDRGRRVLRKGRSLDARALELLRSLGYDTVFVASLDEGDVHEDEAAERIARVVGGKAVTTSRAHTGRVNLSAAGIGVVHVDPERLLRVNEIEGVTVATLPSNTFVRQGSRVATIKVIPYAVPREAVQAAERLESPIGIVAVRTIDPQAVAVVLVGSPGAWKALQEGIGGAIRRRIEGFGCLVDAVELVPQDEHALADVLARLAADGARMIVVAGETAIMDDDDLIPRALRDAGGRSELLGLPMDPGHLLLLGYLGATPVVGAPGCVRGSAPDGFDAVVPRLLSGESLTAGDLRALGHGGLLSDPRTS